MNIEVFFCGNGNTIVFRDGCQVPELTRPWLLMFVNFLKENGVDPLQAKFHLPGLGVAEAFEIEGGEYNWRIL